MTNDGLRLLGFFWNPPTNDAPKEESRLVGKSEDDCEVCTRDQNQQIAVEFSQQQEAESGHFAGSLSRTGFLPKTAETSGKPANKKCLA